MTAATVQGESTFNVRQEWEPNTDESLYGLGQHQQGLLNIKDYDLDLHQYNTEIFIPYLVSSRGYGILWDNTSFSRFGDPSDAVPLPGVTGLYVSSGGEPGDVTPGNGSVNWSGTIKPTTTGDYLFRTFSSGSINLQVNGQTLIDHWRQSWNPGEEIARISLTAGQSVPVKATVDGRRYGQRREAALEAAGRQPEPRRFGPRSATASTTPSSTAPTSTRW
jgi:alpha-D-xyloside xylohydrolase